jgi:4,5-dihydroxyphthalate decarboxylase
VQQRDEPLTLVLPSDPWTHGIEDGTVQVPGLSWNVVSDIDNAPDRFVASHQADVGENGLRRVVLDHLAGKPTAAIPVFFGREHMQRNFLVPKDSPLQRVEDLVGKRVGSWLTVQSGTAAAVLLILQEGYGVPITEIDWRLGDPSSLPANRLGLRLSPGPPTPEACVAALLADEVDAIMITTGPRYWSMFGGGGGHWAAVEEHPELRTLGGDPADIADVYRRTGLYIISDLVVLRPELAAARPDVPAKLLEAFTAANRLASSYRDAHEERLAEREIELLGEDPHQYGMTAAARHNLASYIEFFYRLGAIERPVEPEVIFVPTTVR